MKKYKIDKMKNIGNVIFVVEDQRTLLHDGVDTRPLLLPRLFVRGTGGDVLRRRRGAGHPAP